MCAQFIIKANLEQAARWLAITPSAEEFDGDLNFDLLVLPYKPPAPVFVTEALAMMHFSMVPSWAKERKVKFATHNARLNSEDGKEPIYKKPTWRTPFKTQHCVVPISRFIEPIYIGDMAGNMVKFGQTSGEVLFAAGIWDSWTDRSTGEVIESFAIITDEPPTFVAETGHDRCPIFLGREAARSWLEASALPPEEWFIFLKSKAHTHDIDYSAAIHRPLAKGWEKRIPK